MKRYINIIGIAAVCLSLFSCIEDEGNYTYKNVGDFYPASLTDIGANYEILAGDTLKINPVFNGTTPNESDYEYRWFCYSNSNVTKRDTIGYSKNLDYIVLLKPGDYTLYLKVNIKSTNISSFYKSEIKVTTEFSKGWFLTKETSDGTTDIDFFMYDEKRLLPNMISMMNEGSIPGKPVKTTLLYEGYNIEGKNEPAFIVATQSDIWSLKAEDMSIHYQNNALFREAPDRIEPYDLGTYDDGLCIHTILINAGKLHWIESQMGFLPTPNNDGRYSESLFPAVDFNRYVCKAYNYIGAYMGASGILLYFDNNTHSFGKVDINMYGSALSLRSMSGTSSVAGMPPSCRNMEYDLVYMKEYNGTQGLGIMQKNDGKYYGFQTVNVTPNSVSYPFNAFVPVPEGANVATATVRCVNKTNSTIYSSSGDNKVFAYKVGGRGDAYGTEKQILTLGSDEKVTFMDDIRYTEFKYLVVVTSQGDNWNMYCYNYIGSSDDIDPVPAKTYTGKGRGVHVLYKGLSSRIPEANQF